jgi:hypothetical protein
MFDTPRRGRIEHGNPSGPMFRGVAVVCG